MTDPEAAPRSETSPAGPRVRGLRARRVLLFLAATVFSFLSAAGLFFGFLALWGLVLSPWLKLPSSAPVILAAFVLAVAGSGLIYRAAVKLFLSRGLSKK